MSFKQHASFFRADPDYNKKHGLNLPMTLSPNTVVNNNNNNDNNGSSSNSNRNSNKPSDMADFVSKVVDGVTKTIREEADGDLDEIKRRFAEFKNVMIDELRNAETELNKIMLASLNSPRKRTQRKTRRNRKPRRA